MSGMADVIAAHSGYGTLHSGDWTTAVTWHVYCEGLACDWDEKLEGKAPAGKAFAAHVADELTKAGFGGVREDTDESCCCGTCGL